MSAIKSQHSLIALLICGLFILSVIAGTIMPVRAYDKAPFSDIPYGQWYTSAVSYCYDVGYVGGYEDKTFRPNRTLTRAEMSVIMDKMLKLSGSAENTFSDVKTGTWYTEPVLRCVKAGIMAGYDKKTFGTNDPLTREQGAVILANAFQISKQSGRTSFKDDAAISSWAVGSVKAMADKGYITGMGNNTFEPRSALTRAQMCQIIYAATWPPKQESDDPSEPTTSPVVPEEPSTPSVPEEGFIDPSDAYDLLNAFRTEANAWYWNEDNQTKTVLNNGTGNNLQPLQRNSALEETAKVRAKEIVTQFSHTRPDGSSCSTAYPQGLLAMGENIAYGYSSAQAVTEAWKETNLNYSGQGHRRNMLSGSFNAVGIAGYVYNGQIYWVQSFGKV